MRKVGHARREALRDVVFKLLRSMGELEVSREDIALSWRRLVEILGQVSEAT